MCQALDFPCAAIYAERARALSNVAQLLPCAAVRSPRRRTASDLRRSVPIWLVRRSSVKGRARYGRACVSRTTSQDDIRVSRARVSPLLREHGLLSPHRRPQKPPNAHDSRTTTDRPNEMWGADGAKVQTVDEGLV
ncbi:MAG: hypothetical protein VB137_08700 [Burkholderia sp.]